jgi:hypothetical protein
MKDKGNVLAVNGCKSIEDELSLIDRLKGERDCYKNELKYANNEKEALNKLCGEQKAEIERLKDTKFKMIDKFRDTLADEYLRLCNYNDFNKLNLERIVDTLSEVFDNLVKEMVGDVE